MREGETPRNKIGDVMHYHEPGYILTKRATFAAAHYLPGHPKCGHIHGHTWRVEVEFGADVPNPETGMVVDFAELDAGIQEILPDHKLLNEVYSFSPTAENLAYQFWHELDRLWKDRIYAVTVWESENSSVRFSPGTYAYWQAGRERGLC